MAVVMDTRQQPSGQEAWEKPKKDPSIKVKTLLIKFRDTENPWSMFNDYTQLATTILKLTGIFYYLLDIRH